MFEFTYTDPQKIDGDTVIVVKTHSESLEDVVDNLHTFLLHVYSYVKEVKVITDNGNEWSSN